MVGYLIPRNYMEAMEFDSENKNSKWYDAIKLEKESTLEYKVFKKWDNAILDKHKNVMNCPKAYHRIKVHLVFAVRFDGRHKARLMADGHITPEPIENIYSVVVSLRNRRLVIFLGKLNHLDLWGTDIGNAYLPYMVEIKHRWRLSTNQRFFNFFFDIELYLIEYCYVLLLQHIVV